MDNINNFDDIITRPKTNKTSNLATTKTIRYDHRGLNDTNFSEKFSDNRSVALLTIVEIKNNVSKTYKIKSQRNGQLFNPLKISQIYGLDKLDKTTKEPMFKYKTVSEEAFNHYIKFLETKYDSHLILAERLA